MKKFLAVMLVLGLGVIYLGCEKKATEPVATEEQVEVVEQVTPPPAPAPVVPAPVPEPSGEKK